MSNEQENAGLTYIDMGLNEVEAADGSYVNLKAGEYVFEVEEVSGGQSRAQKPKMGVRLKVVEALNKPNEDEAGRSFTQSMSLDRTSEFARRRLRSFVEACGAEIDERGGFAVKEIMGAQFIAEVRNRTTTEKNALTGQTETNTFMSVFRERHITMLDEVKAAIADAEKKNGKNGAAAAAAASKEAAKGSGDKAKTTTRSASPAPQR